MESDNTPCLKIVNYGLFPSSSESDDEESFNEDRLSYAEFSSRDSIGPCLKESYQTPDVHSKWNSDNNSEVDNTEENSICTEDPLVDRTLPSEGVKRTDVEYESPQVCEPKSKSLIALACYDSDECDDQPLERGSCLLEDVEIASNDNPVLNESSNVEEELAIGEDCDISLNKPCRRAYSLPRSEWTPCTRQLIEDVKRYFTKTVNLRRASGPVSLATFNKITERLSCYLGFLKYVRRLLLVEKDVFGKRVLIEAYLEYLSEKRCLNPSTISNHVSALIYVLKYLHSDLAPHYHNVPLIAQLRKTATNLQRQGEEARPSTSQDLENLGKWLDWDQILQCLSLQRRHFESEVDCGKKPRLLMDLVLLACYCQLPPARCLEIRTLRIWKAPTRLDLKMIQEKGWNVVFLSQSGDISLHFQSYKTRKFRGHDQTIIEAGSELAHLIKDYLRTYRYKLLFTEEEEHGFLFLNCQGKMFTGPAFTNHLKAMFYRLSGVEISVNVLRSSFVTRVYSQQNCSDSLKASLAHALRHSIKQSQKTYDRRSAVERKAEACNFARQLAEENHDDSEIPNQEQSNQASSAEQPFKLGQFVALVEKNSTLKKPQVLIGRIQHYTTSGEASLLWYKHDKLNAYTLELDGSQWCENVEALHAVEMVPSKKKAGQFQLSTSLRTVHKAVFGNK